MRNGKKMRNMRLLLLSVACIYALFVHTACVLKSKTSFEQQETIVQPICEPTPTTKQESKLRAKLRRRLLKSGFRPDLLKQEDLDPLAEAIFRIDFAACGVNSGPYQIHAGTRLKMDGSNVFFDVRLSSNDNTLFGMGFINIDLDYFTPANFREARPKFSESIYLINGIGGGDLMSNSSPYLPTLLHLEYLGAGIDKKQLTCISEQIVDNFDRCLVDFKTTKTLNIKE